LDNLSAHRGVTIRKWATRNKVELCLTPTYSSWANPIEAHVGPLREFVLNNSNDPAGRGMCGVVMRTIGPSRSQNTSSATIDAVGGGGG